MLTRRRLVLDTHVWLDWLVFDDPGITRIRNAVGLKRAEIFIDAVCEAELARVLAYDLHKRKLDAAAQAACIAQCRRLSHRIDATLPEPQRAGLPRCRDPDEPGAAAPRPAPRALAAVSHRDTSLFPLK